MTSPRGVAAIVVDGNSGRTLFAVNENQPRHPASVTKVMTLYLLFEQLEKGRLRLNSPLMISQHAAAQAPSKLGLQPGETIEVEHAIKAVVTKSANDIAVAIAENIGGDEDSFARMMTNKAHALGMHGTHFANASGLPNSEQITTAHDLAVLGRAIQDRFPHYYRYFSTHTFAYRGAVMRNHNHLLGQVEGMDGIKTGYTAASGFNLLTSVRRGGHHIVAVVLGGATAGARDRYMANLIEDHIDDGAGVRTAAAITEDQPAERVAAIEPEPEPAPRSSPNERSRATPLRAKTKRSSRPPARANSPPPRPPSAARRRRVRLSYRVERSRPRTRPRRPQGAWRRARSRRGGRRVDDDDWRQDRPSRERRHDDAFRAEAQQLGRRSTREIRRRASRAHGLDDPARRHRRRWKGHRTAHARPFRWARGARQAPRPSRRKCGKAMRRSIARASPASRNSPQNPPARR